MFSKCSHLVNMSSLARLNKEKVDKFWVNYKKLLIFNGADSTLKCNAVNSRSSERFLHHLEWCFKA